MLAFEDLNLNNWHVYVDLVLKSEAIFPESIRTSKEEFTEILLIKDTIAKVAIDSGYVGNIMGYPLVSLENLEEYGLQFLEERAIYISNLVIESTHQGKGFGKKLLLEFIKAAIDNGYEKVYGHFRQNHSLVLIKKLGARELKVFPNWSDTGEDFVLCELDLLKASIPEIPQMVKVEAIG